MDLWERVKIWFKLWIVLSLRSDYKKIVWIIKSEYGMKNIVGKR